MLIKRQVLFKGYRGNSKKKDIRKKYNDKNKIIPRTVSSKIKDVMEGARTSKNKKDDKKDAEFYDTSKVDTITLRD